MILPSHRNGSGPALLLVHGFPLHAGMWRHQLDGLAEVRDVLAVDLRGHGTATRDDEAFSMDRFADDIAETLDAEGIESIDLGALSMGGYVAFAFWRRHPERVRSLIFMDTKPEPDGDEAKKGREGAAALVRENGMAALHEGLGPKLLASNPSPESVEALREIILACDPETAALDALAMRDRADSVPTLATITVPTLWVHGVEDALMPLDGARASAAAIAGCVFAEIPDAGHMAPLENPEATNAAIRAHLERVDG